MNMLWQTKTHRLPVNVAFWPTAAKNGTQAGRITMLEFYLICRTVLTVQAQGLRIVDINAKDFSLHILAGGEP